MSFIDLLIFVLLLHFEYFFLKYACFDFYTVSECVIVRACVCEIYSCVWLWSYSCQEWLWRSEGSLKYQSTPHLTPCLRQGLCFLLLHMQSHLVTHTKDPSIVISHLVVGILGLQICATTSGFLWVLGIKTQVLVPCGKLSESSPQSLVLIFSLDWFYSSLR